jgi:hypothetical protein
MATLWERAQNLIDDHQDRQALSNSVTQKSQALYATRDALLATALEVHHNYRDELAVTSDADAKKAIHATYAARIAGINDAFTVLRQSEPGITTQIDVQEYRQNAERQAERQAEQQARLRAYEQAGPAPTYEQSRTLAPSSIQGGFSY